MRDYLIIVRAGDESLHPGWMAEERSFDLMVTYFGKEEGKFREGAEHYHAMPGPRWPAYHAICEERWELVKRYEYVAFACDDVAAPAGTWDRLFRICREQGVDLGQPGIEGPVSHPVTVRQPRCLLRLTNFVEIMVPVFRREILEKLRWTLGESASGWGLDFLWSSLLPWPEYRMGIIDGAPVRHSRGIGEGPLQRVLEDRGVRKKEEMMGLLARHGITRGAVVEYLWVLAEEGG